MNYRNDNDVRIKYGNDCVLTKENIKDIYFLLDCNNFRNSSEVDNFLKDNFNQSEIISWNEEYINVNLDLCYSLLSDDGWATLKQIGTILRKVSFVYTNNRNTYERLIEFIILFYKTYGYFMNNIFVKKTENFPYEDDTFTNFDSIFICEISDKSLITDNKVLNFSDDGYAGIIPHLLRAGNAALLQKLLSEIILPVFEHYSDDYTDVCKKYGITKFDDAIPADERALFRTLKKYSVKYSFSLPNDLKTFMDGYELTESKAKEYFFKKQCRISRIDMDDADKADKFRSFNLSNEILDNWTNEWLEAELESKDFKTDYYSFCSITEDLGYRINRANTEKLISVYYQVKDSIPADNRKAILFRYYKSEIGNNIYYGLLYIAVKNGLSDYIDGLESELFTLMNKDAARLMENNIKAMYKEFNVKR